MEKIAFISGGTFIYWSSIVMGLAVITAVCAFAALYYAKSNNALATGLMIPLSCVTSLVISRLIHWYCRADSYESFASAMTDYSSGGYALMGIFLGCFLAITFGIIVGLKTTSSAIAVGMQYTSCLWLFLLAKPKKNDLHPRRTWPMLLVLLGAAVSMFSKAAGVTLRLIAFSC